MGSDVRQSVNSTDGGREVIVQTVSNIIEAQETKAPILTKVAHTLSNLPAKDQILRLRPLHMPGKLLMRFL